jgi:hypothetical protein
MRNAHHPLNAYAAYRKRFKCRWHKMTQTYLTSSRNFFENGHSYLTHPSDNFETVEISRFPNLMMIIYTTFNTSAIMKNTTTWHDSWWKNDLN